jgi:hypothetical protein
MNTPTDKKPYRPTHDIVPSRASHGKGLDLVTREGAEHMVRELDEWWHSRGFPQVKHWADYATARRVHTRKKDGKTVEEDHRFWAVRSNLVNGLPPKAGTS